VHPSWRRKGKNICALLACLFPLYEVNSCRYGMRDGGVADSGLVKISSG